MAKRVGGGGVAKRVGRGEVAKRVGRQRGWELGGGAAKRVGGGGVAKRVGGGGAAKRVGWQKGWGGVAKSQTPPEKIIYTRDTPTFKLV